MQSIEFYHNNKKLSCENYMFDVVENYNTNFMVNTREENKYLSRDFNDRFIKFDIEFINKMQLSNFIIEIDDDNFMNWYHKQKKKLREYKKTLKKHSHYLVNTTYNNIGKITPPESPLLDSFKLDNGNVIDYNRSYLSLIGEYIDKSNKEFYVKHKGDLIDKNILLYHDNYIETDGTKHIVFSGRFI